MLPSMILIKHLGHLHDGQCTHQKKKVKHAMRDTSGYYHVEVTASSSFNLHCSRR